MFKNYRPVSSLPFLSKILENVAAKRLVQHLTDNSLHEELQSAYKPLHSTETALMIVQHDITSSLAGSRGVLLVHLNLSAAFDMIDASILLKTMNEQLGISGPYIVQFICVRSYPVHADWDRHNQRMSSEVRYSTRLGARTAAVHCVHSTNAGHTKEACCGIPSVCR